MEENTTVAMAVSMTTISNSSEATESTIPEPPYMRVILIYYILCAIILGFLLLCALRVTFMLLFYDFFYPTEEEVKEMMEEREARRKKLEKAGKNQGQNTAAVTLALSGDHLEGMPPRMFLLHQAYEKQRAESMLGINNV